VERENSTRSEKKDAVTAALAEYVQRRKQLRILKAFGAVDFDPKYDYKAERRNALLTMLVLVDTRRLVTSAAPQRRRLTSALQELIEDGRAQLVGSVRQELLSGIRQEASFKKLRDQLRAFEHAPLMSPIAKTLFT